VSAAPLSVLVVVGSVQRLAATRAVLEHVAELLRRDGCHVDILDLRDEPLPIFNPDTSYAHPPYAELKTRVERADVYLLGTPDYHGCPSGALKNFLDHFWQEFAGKLFATIVASHEKGLTVTEQLRTIARQCYAWSMPYAVSFAEKSDVKDGQIVSEPFHARLKMLARDLRVYGELLSRQRQADLTQLEPGFMARYRQ
jgi:FMN reductase